MPSFAAAKQKSSQSKTFAKKTGPKSGRKARFLSGAPLLR
jgi:hypothetical protein